MLWNLLLVTVLATAPADTLLVPLEEVVVTGTRVPENVLRVPAAISVVDRRHFDATRNISLKDALGRMPGVFVQSRSGAQDVRVTIRGFGARGNGDRSNAGNMRGIRVLTDGLPLTEPDGRTSLELADVGEADRIEVARSNVSALYGNASGGIVNLRSNLEFDRPFGEARSRFGSFGFHREQAVAGFAVGEARGTLSLLNSNLDGWREHSGSATTLAQLRFATPLDPKTRLGVLVDGSTVRNFFPGPLTRAQLEADPRQADSLYRARNERRFNRVGRIGLTLDRAIEASQSFSITAFAEPKVLQRSERNRFRDFTRYHVGGSALYQIRSQLSEAFEGIATLGADDQFQDGAILFYNVAPGGTRGTTLVANKREGANGAGGFVQGELRWMDRWSLRLAGRYDNLKYISKDFIEPALDADKTFERWTPKASLARLFASHTVYAAVGGGVEAPAFNEIDPPPPFDTLTALNPFLDPMHSVSYELGAKGEVGLGTRWGRLRYDVALYQIDVRNDIVPFNGGAFFFTVGESRRRGAELGLDWRPLGRLSVNGALTLSDNEYVSYTNVVRELVDGRGDLSGNEIAGLPSALLSAGADYRLPLGISAGVSVDHVGGYFADDANTAEAKAYTLIGASASFERVTPFGLVKAFVAGENLADEAHVASVFINGTGGRYFEPGLPRNWSGGLTLRFQ